MLVVGYIRPLEPTDQCVEAQWARFLFPWVSTLTHSEIFTKNRFRYIILISTSTVFIVDCHLNSTVFHFNIIYFKVRTQTGSENFNKNELRKISVHLLEFSKELVLCNINFTPGGRGVAVFETFLASVHMITTCY